MIYNFVQDICEILEIPVPEISFDTSCFLTKTTLAQIDINNNTIYMKKIDKPNPDQFFAIAHELRHMWQAQNNRELYFSSYKTSNLYHSIEEFNLQLAEIDANAFAGVIMADFFHLKPTFDNLSESVKDKIYERMKLWV